MPLTALAAQKAKPRSKPYKLFDERGLFLLVKPNGSKLWRFKYHYCQKEKQLSFGLSNLAERVYEMTGNNIPDTNKSGPIRVTEDAKNFLVEIHPDDRERAKMISGRQWDGTRKAWVYAKTPITYESLVAEFKRDADLFEIRRPKTQRPPGITNPHSEDDDEEYDWPALEEIGEGQSKSHDELADIQSAAALFKEPPVGHDPVIDTSSSASWECYRIPRVSDPDDWRRLIEKQLEADESPYDYDIQGQVIRVWPRESPTISIRHSPHRCRNVFRIQRVGFGGSRSDTLIGITIARVFFEGGGSIPSFRSAMELFEKGHYPPVLRHESMLKDIEELVSFLRQAAQLSELHLHDNFDGIDLSERIVYVTSEGKRSLYSLTRDDGLSKNLLELVRTCSAVQPARIGLGILGQVSIDESKAFEIAKHVLQVLEEWGCSVSWYDLAEAQDVETFISIQGQVNIVLIPLEGKRGDRPPESALEWIRYLDSEKAAFQLCSTSSDPRYSRHGLAIAILSKAGGVHFATEPISREFFGNCWYVGLDLGLGGQRHGKIAAITLTDPAGGLKAYWRALKNNTESLPLDVLFHGLRWVTSKAEELKTGREYILIRDGRRPQDEDLDHYKVAMEPLKFTLIEFIKRGTPIIHDALREPNPGTLIIPDNSPFAALYACLSPQHGILSSPSKFRTSFNPHGLSIPAVGEILTALCHSATLSFQPAGVPSPIQWSNGLAKLSCSDLQFSGWAHLPNLTVDLRA